MASTILPAAETVARLEGLWRRIDQAEINDLHAGPGEFRGHFPQVTLQPLLEAGELGPISVESDAEESDANRVFHGDKAVRIGWCGGVGHSEENRKACNSRDVQDTRMRAAAQAWLDSLAIFFSKILDFFKLLSGFNMLAKRAEKIKWFLKLSGTFI